MNENRIGKAMSEENIMEARALAKGYRIGRSRLEVLHEVNWSIRRDSWSALLGASGSGKTTLLNLFGALERPDGGELFFEGESMFGWSGRRAAAFRADSIGFVFQSYQLLPELTMLENVMLPARLSGMKGGDCRRRALALLERFGLSQRLAHHPMELSGGEQQRAAIARALVKSPRLLLADEPTGNLDAASGEAILQLIEELRRSEQLTVVMITHNAEVAARADFIAHLVDGRIADEIPRK